MPRYFVVGFLALLSSAYGASLTADQQRTARIMRQERTKASEFNTASTEEEYLSAPEYLCNDDYVQGPPLKDACTDVAHHHHIQTPEMCMQAATEFNLRTHVANGVDLYCQGTACTKDFYTPYSAWDNHPKGCYTDDCGDTQGGTCVYFNKVQTAPTNSLTGTVVCYRKRLVLGTEDSVGDNTSCPGTEYEPIGTTTFCEEAAACLGYAANSQPTFIVDANNRTLHDFYPQGCLIHKIHNTVGMVDSVSFNPSDRKDIDGNHWVPGAPKGVPICTVKNPARTIQQANLQHGRNEHSGANKTTAEAATANTGTLLEEE